MHFLSLFFNQPHKYDPDKVLSLHTNSLRWDGNLSLSFHLLLHLSDRQCHVAPIHYRGSGAAEGNVCAKSCQTGYSFQKHRMLLQALCTADDYTPQCLMKSCHAESCKEHNTLLYILQNIRFMIAIHLLANDNLDSNNFARVSSISRIEDKNRVVQGGDLALQGGCLCWIHCFQRHLTPSLSPVLRVWLWNVDLAHVGRVWISHHPWRAAFWLEQLHLGWVFSPSWVFAFFSPPFLEGDCLFFSSYPDAISMSPFLSASPAPCMGRGRSRHSLYSPNVICTRKL